MNPTKILRTEFPKGRRVLVTSDIHGHANHLARLLEQARFAADDILVIVGDLLERGTENLQVVRDVMQLSHTHTVYTLLGNVDEWALDKVLSLDAEGLMRDMEAFLAHYGGSFIHDLARELGMEVSPTMDLEAFRAGVRRHFAPEYAFMEGLPTILQTPEYTFVHGGIPEGPVDALEGQPARMLTKRDAFMDEGLTMDRWTIVGHWPVCLYAGETMQFSPIINAAQRIIAIDGGCGVKPEGQLNLLMLQDGRIEWSSYDDLPKRVALDAQAAANPGHHITYMNGDVDILAHENGLTQVRHRPTGHVMWVPDVQLFTGQDGTVRCSDISDYRLPVSPGDTLTILWETARGTVCKKDGVEGWYRGRFAE